MDSSSSSVQLPVQFDKASVWDSFSDVLQSSSHQTQHYSNLCKVSEFRDTCLKILNSDLCSQNRNLWWSGDTGNANCRTILMAFHCTSKQVLSACFAERFCNDKLSKFTILEFIWTPSWGPLFCFEQVLRTQNFTCLSSSFNELPKGWLDLEVYVLKEHKKVWGKVLKKSCLSILTFPRTVFELNVNFHFSNKQVFNFNCHSCSCILTSCRSRIQTCLTFQRTALSPLWMQSLLLHLCKASSDCTYTCVWTRVNLHVSSWAGICPNLCTAIHQNSWSSEMHRLKHTNMCPKWNWWIPACR